MNGQLLTSLTASIHGILKSQLLFDYDEVPDPLIKEDINVSNCCLEGGMERGEERVGAWGEAE